uniref:Putative secreted protein n=1 Tax=Ixodes scapularis TaxID=6945 RepID=A0A4D5RDE1_IXOSC
MSSSSVMLAVATVVSGSIPRIRTRWTRVSLSLHSWRSSQGLSDQSERGTTVYMRTRNRSRYKHRLQFP